MSFLLTFIHLQWWVYLVVVFTFFSVALVLNYLVKKINESRLDERFMRLQNNASNNRIIEGHRQFETKLPPKKLLDVVVEQSNPPTVKGISLVFNKDYNLVDDRRIDKIDIRNFPNQKTQVVDATSSTHEDDTSEQPKPTDFGKFDGVSKAPNLDDENKIGGPSDRINNTDNDKKSILQNQAKIGNTSDPKSNADNEQKQILQNNAKTENSLDPKTSADNDREPILQNSSKIENSLDPNNKDRDKPPILQNNVNLGNSSVPKNYADDDNGAILQNKAKIENSSNPKIKEDITKRPFLESMYNELSKIDQRKSSPFKIRCNAVNEKSLKVKDNSSIPSLKKLQRITQEEKKCCQ